jgi:hypothetical protein
MRRWLAGCFGILFAVFAFSVAATAHAQTRQNQPPPTQPQQPQQEQPQQQSPQQPRQPQQPQQRQRAQPGVAEIPVQIGVGPAGYILAGPTFPSLRFGGLLYEDQPLHYGLRINITAVITGDLIRNHPGLVPRQYARQIMQAGEVRYRPGVLGLIPRSLYLTPPIGNAMSVGATWAPIGLGLVLASSPVRVSVSGALIGTLMYIRSPSVATSNYLFARPGVELNLDFEIPLSERFLISLGWSSMVHVPQTLEATGLESLGMGGLDQQSLWHIGQFYVQGHYRVPYKHSYRPAR